MKSISTQHIAGFFIAYTKFCCVLLPPALYSVSPITHKTSVTMDGEIVKTFCAKVEEVHSADDYILLVNLGVDGLFKRVRARLFGVDTPNAYKAAPDTEAGALRDECKAALAGRCLIELISEGKGGWIVRMYTQESDTVRVCINEVLRERGYVYTPTRRGGV